MKNAFTIAGKELRSYFVSPIAYVVLTGFLLLGGWFFFNLLARFNFLLSIYSFVESFNSNQYGLGSAIALVMVLAMLTVPLVYIRQKLRMGEID